MKYRAFVSVTTVRRANPDTEPAKLETITNWAEVGSAESLINGSIRLELLTLPFDPTRWAGTIILTPEEKKE